MNKTFAYVAAVLALGAVLLVPFEAAARPLGPPVRHHHHHGAGAGIVAAGILGVALGAAIAAEPKPVVYRPSVVYAPPSPVYIQQPAPVYVQAPPQVVYQQPAPVYVQVPQAIVYQQLPPAPVQAVPTPFNSTCAPYAQPPAATPAPAMTAPAGAEMPAETIPASDGAVAQPGSDSCLVR